MNATYLRLFTAIFTIILATERLLSIDHYILWRRFSVLIHGEGLTRFSIYGKSIEAAFALMVILCSVTLLFSRKKLLATALLYLFFMLDQKAFFSENYSALGMYINSALFYLLLFEIFKLKPISEYLGKNGLDMQIALTAFKFHITGIYLVSALSRLHADQWLTGLILQQILTDPIYYSSLFPWPEFPEHKMFYGILSKVIIFSETAFPIALHTGMRKAALSGLVFFHLFIIFVMGLSYIGLFSILCLVVFMDEITIHKKLSWKLPLRPGFLKQVCRLGRH